MIQEELIEKDKLIKDVIRGYTYTSNLSKAVVEAVKETVFYVFDVERPSNRFIKLTSASVSLKAKLKWSGYSYTIGNFKLAKYEKNKTVGHSSKYFDNGISTSLKIFTDLKEAKDAYKLAIQNSIRYVEDTIEVHEKAITNLEAIKDELEDGSKMYI